MTNCSFKGNKMETMHNLLVQSGWTYFGGTCYALDNSIAKIENLHLVLKDSGYQLWSSSEDFLFDTFYIESERDVKHLNSICLL
jgi:hypothetical protein